MKRTTHRVLLRLAAGAVLCLGLGAPSPGYIGGCGNSSGASVADPVQFCLDKETYVCARECMTGRYTAEMCSMLCATAEQIRNRCMISWPPGCAPTQSRTAACIEALRDPARLSTPYRDIVECDYTASLCSSAALLGPEPEGI